MRGISVETRNGTERFGNTPADAGNLRSCTPRNGLPRKHPRRCGESILALGGVAGAAETPPQMRGIFATRSTARGRTGNTPADAGNLPSTTHHTESLTKHPRRCGESVSFRINRNHSPETPPQMRGIFRRGKAEPRNPRNTPADAGNLASPSFSSP